MNPAAQPGPRAQAFSVFSLAFRPFFLAAALLAVVLMAAWLLHLFGAMPISGYLEPVTWHGHEMIFGFASAIVTGFILTAVQTWTGLRSTHGQALVLLFVLWLSARLLLAFASPDLYILAALVDLTFTPLTMWHFGRLVIRARQSRNMVFLPVLGLLFVANFLVHLQAFGFGTTAHSGLKLGLWCLVLIIILIGGRVIPFFTKNRIAGLTVFSHPWLEIGCIASVILLAGSDLFGLVQFVPWFAALCAVLHGVRLWGWRPLQTRSVPLLWILHIGYAWLVLGFVLLALQGIFDIPYSVPLHAFAVGGMSTIILGMISRVSLGHTGRTLEPSAWMTFAFILINLAAFSRVLLPLLLPQGWTHEILFAGIAWIIAFAVFVAVYTPVLTQPRVDGKEG